jgi:hypothetical protein
MWIKTYFFEKKANHIVRLTFVADSTFFFLFEWTEPYFDVMRFLGSERPVSVGL